MKGVEGVRGQGTDRWQRDDSTLTQAPPRGFLSSQANPLLEAMGNATTARNTNSSRFGKCVRLEISTQSGELVGGLIIT